MQQVPQDRTIVIVFSTARGMRCWWLYCCDAWQFVTLWQEHGGIRQGFSQERSFSRNTRTPTCSHPHTHTHAHTRTHTHARTPARTRAHIWQSGLLACRQRCATPALNELFIVRICPLQQRMSQCAHVQPGLTQTGHRACGRYGDHFPKTHPSAVTEAPLCP